MSSLHRLRLPPVVRVIVLGLLVLGLVVKPVLVAACEIGDAQRTLASGHDQTMTAPDSGGGDECCPEQGCNECCAHTAALVTTAASTATRLNTVPLPTLSATFEPAAYPVGLRPPIAG